MNAPAYAYAKAVAVWTDAHILEVLSAVRHIFLSLSVAFLHDSATKQEAPCR